MKKNDLGFLKGRKINRREFLAEASKLGIVITSTNLFPRVAWGADPQVKETKQFKVRWKNPKGKKFSQGTTLGYLSWEPWCRPYQMDIFTDHTGVKVETAIFKSTKEMLTKLGAGAAKSYDLFSPSQYSPKQCIEAGWFQPINLDNVPHYKDLHPIFKKNPYVFINGKDYMVPFVWGTDAVINNVEKIPVFDSWSFLYDPKYKGRITMWDNAVNAIATIAIYLGYKKPFELGEEDLQKVKKEFVKIKPQLRTFHTSDSQADTLMASGEVWAVALAHVAQIEPIKAAGVKINWSWPKEGSYGWFEGITISSFTKNKEAAEIFADWCIGEELGAIIARDIGYYPCSTSCKPNLTRDEIKLVYLDNPEVPTKTFMMEMPRNVDRWQEIWSEIKAM
jgi:spermidine/putrescine-binding protein